MSAELPEGRVGGEEFIDGQAFVDAQGVQRRGLHPGIRGLPWVEYLLDGVEHLDSEGMLAILKRYMNLVLGL